jgi:predicted  nucleic acid-binding Zn-ribbon protein
MISHLVETLETVQTELQQLEAGLSRQFAETRQQEIKQAEDEVRKSVTRELLERFEIEFHKLGSEFEEQRRHTITATESAAEMRYKHALDEAERAKQELKRELEFTLKEWEAERKQWAAAKSASVDQQEELKEAKSRWNAELNNLKSEAEQSRQQLTARFEEQINQLKAEFEGQRVKVIAATESAAEIRFRQVLDDAKQAFETEQAGLKKQIEEINAKLREAKEQLQCATAGWDEERKKLEAAPPVVVEKTKELSDKAKAEISRVEALIRDISRKMEAASSDLGAEIRLNRERTELEAYLKGLQYGTSQK